MFYYDEDESYKDFKTTPINFTKNFKKHNISKNSSTQLTYKNDEEVISTKVSIGAPLNGENENITNQFSIDNLTVHHIKFGEDIYENKLESINETDKNLKQKRNKRNEIVEEDIDKNRLKNYFEPSLNKPLQDQNKNAEWKKGMRQIAQLYRSWDDAFYTQVLKFHCWFYNSK